LKKHNSITPILGGNLKSETRGKNKTKMKWALKLKNYNFRPIRSSNHH